MKGVYILTIRVKKNTTLTVGALGKMTFSKGEYCYVGSAQNSIERRIKRHQSKTKKLRWHIDYLLKDKKTFINDVFVKECAKEEECRLAALLNTTEIPVKKFGSSDCKCLSHLFRLKNDHDFKASGFERIFL